MHWQRLDRDNTIKIIDSVKSAAAPGLISQKSSAVERAYLSFYKNIFLYKITNYASLPSFTFEYLGDGTFFHYLDGTEEPIYAVNQKTDMQLTPNTVIDYLGFFFAHVSDEDGDKVLITNPHDMPMLDSLGMKSMDALIASYQPPSAVLDGDGKFKVTADLYEDGTMTRATILVSSRGRVEVTEEKMIHARVAPKSLYGDEDDDILDESY